MTRKVKLIWIQGEHPPTDFFIHDNETVCELRQHIQNVYSDMSAGFLLLSSGSLLRDSDLVLDREHVTVVHRKIIHVLQYGRVPEVQHDPQLDFARHPHTDMTHSGVQVQPGYPQPQSPPVVWQESTNRLTIGSSRSVPDILRPPSISAKVSAAKPPQQNNYQVQGEPSLSRVAMSYERNNALGRGILAGESTPGLTIRLMDGASLCISRRHFTIRDDNLYLRKSFLDSLSQFSSGPKDTSPQLSQPAYPQQQEQQQPRNAGAVFHDLFLLARETVQPLLTVEYLSALITMSLFSIAIVIGWQFMSLSRKLIAILIHCIFFFMFYIKIRGLNMSVNTFISLPDVYRRAQSADELMPIIPKEDLLRRRLTVDNAVQNMRLPNRFIDELKIFLTGIVPAWHLEWVTGVRQRRKMHNEAIVKFLELELKRLDEEDSRTEKNQTMCLYTPSL